MVNALNIPAPARWWEVSLKRSRKRSSEENSKGEILYRYNFQTELYTSSHGISWTKNLEALDLAHFDKAILTLSDLQEAWRELPAIVQLWFRLRDLELGALLTICD